MLISSKTCSWSGTLSCSIQDGLGEVQTMAIGYRTISISRGQLLYVLFPVERNPFSFCSGRKKSGWLNVSEDRQTRLRLTDLGNF